MLGSFINSRERSVALLQTSMLVDTHIHLYLDEFEEDFRAVLRRATDADVRIMIMPAIDVASVEKAVDLCGQYDGLYAMAALHPSEIKDCSGKDFNRVVELCSHPAVVAVGETGLDYYWDQSFNDKQQDYLRRHIQLAEECDLPLVFHNREASEDLVAVVREAKAGSAHPERIRGVFHCFSGPASLADEILSLGFHVGIGGTLTFKNGGVPGAIVDIPLSSIVLETDAPFLSPVPFRGKRNEPAHVRLIAEKLAELRGLSFEEISQQTSANALRLFDLDPAKVLTL